MPRLLFVFLVFVIALVVIGAVVFLTVRSRSGGGARPSLLTRPMWQVIVDHVEQVRSHKLNNERYLDVFLPPDYDYSEQAYPVLYVNDGQDAQALKIKNTLETLYMRNKMERIIVVAVPTNHDRLNEYGTAGQPDYKGRGARAAEYTDFLLYEVMPYVNAKYRVLEGPENTVILGASLGGLSAFDIAWKHAEMFGKVGVFSGSFWWRTNDQDWHTKQESRIMHRVVRDSPKNEGLKFWFEAGTRDETSDRDNNGVIDAIQDTTELMDELGHKGYVAGVDMVYVQIEGGEHNPATWARALPEFLKWAFGE